MACFHPVTAYQSPHLQSNGKYEIVFQHIRGQRLGYRKIAVPCQKCDGCLLERSKSWAVRCMHEAQLHDRNCFITLTFSDEWLPQDMSLHHKDFADFMKRFKSHVAYHEGSSVADAIRRYHCGEYGELYGRPHHHACIFGYDFSDKYIWKTSNGVPLYRSPTLEKLWPYGYSSIGSVTFESAAYVARYIMKKVTHNQADEHYKFVHPYTGKVYQRKPEYNSMSRRPGLARGWFDKYAADVYPGDFVVIRDGVKIKPPRYYDKLFELGDPISFEHIKFDRFTKSLKHVDDNTPERLKVREQVLKRNLKRLPRKLDQESC